MTEKGAEEQVLAMERLHYYSNCHHIYDYSLHPN